MLLNYHIGRFVLGSMCVTTYVALMVWWKHILLRVCGSGLSAVCSSVLSFSMYKELPEDGYI